MHHAKVIFEEISTPQILLLYYHLRRGSRIAFFGVAGSEKKPILGKLVRKGRITEIPPMGQGYNDCHGMSLDNIDRVYEFVKASSSLIEGMIELHEDVTIEMAYKKELAKKLSQFYYVSSYMAQQESMLQPDERILFVSSEFKRYLKLVRNSGAFCPSHDNIDFACTQGWWNLKGIKTFVEKGTNWFLQLSVMAVFCGKLVMSPKGTPRTNKYKHAIAIVNPDFQMKFKTRPVDFLLDRNAINKVNTVFILLAPNISKDNMDEIQSKGLSVIDCSKRIVLPRGFATNEKLHLLKKIVRYNIRNIFHGLFERDLVIHANSVLLVTFLKWSSILQQISVKNLIVLNDEGISHISRNILLNKSGAKTWYYAHSGSLEYFTIPLNYSSLNSNRHWLWSFLYYDYYISWNDEMTKYYALHPQAIRNYVTIGCLWAQPIREILENGLSSNFIAKAFPEFMRTQYKVLSFFDSSYGPNSISPLEDGIAFYRAILNLLDEFSGILVIIKEKKAVATVVRLYQLHGGSREPTEQYQSILAELKAHPRCHFTGYKGDPSEIMAASHLTITYAFSSSTLEALSARRKAIYFDPSNRRRGCRYDLIPNLVAHDYDELKCLVHKLLYETDEEEYSEFLNTHVKGVIDPYLDGKAVTRFRKLLSEKADTPFEQSCDLA